MSKQQQQQGGKPAAKTGVKKKKGQTQIVKNLKGVVLRYNDRQARGTVQAQLSGGLGKTDIPVRKNNILNKNKSLRPGAHVRFNCFIDERNNQIATNVRVIPPFLDLYYGTIVHRNYIRPEKQKKFDKDIYWQFNYCLDRYDAYNIGERVEFEVSKNKEYKCYEAYNIKKAKQFDYYGRIIEMFMQQDDEKKGKGKLKDVDTRKIYEFISDNVKGFADTYEGDYVKFNIDYSNWDVNSAIRVKKCKKPRHLITDGKQHIGYITMIRNNKYGFIKPDTDKAKQDLYFTVEPEYDGQIMKNNDKVKFNVETNKNNKKVYAVNVTKIIEEKKDNKDDEKSKDKVKDNIRGNNKYNNKGNNEAKNNEKSDEKSKENDNSKDDVNNKLKNGNQNNNNNNNTNNNQNKKKKNAKNGIANGNH